MKTFEMKTTNRALRRTSGKVTKRGITMMETVLALIIGLFALVGVLVYFGQAQTTNQAIEYEQEVMGIVGNVTQLYSGQSDYSTLTTQIVAQSGLLPNKYSSDQQTVVTPTKGKVTITPQSINGGTNNSFQIQFASVPNKVCSNLLTSDFGANMLDHSVNGQSFGTSPAPASALQVCSQGKNQNTMSWTFAG